MDTYWPLHTPLKRETLTLSSNSSKVLEGHGVRKCAFWKRFLPQLGNGKFDGRVGDFFYHNSPSAISTPPQQGFHIGNSVLNRKLSIKLYVSDRSSYLRDGLLQWCLLKQYCFWNLSCSYVYIQCFLKILRQPFQLESMSNCFGPE